MMFLAQLGTMPGFQYFMKAGIFKVQKRKEKLSISQPFLAFEKFLQVHRYLILLFDGKNYKYSLNLTIKKRNEQRIYFMFCSS